MKRLILTVVFSAMALTGIWAADEGMNLGPLRLNLWGEVSGTYDDNVRLVVPDGEIQERAIFTDDNTAAKRDTEDDIYYELTLGGRLYRETDSFLASLSGIYSARRYTDTTDLDNESFIQEADILFGEREIDRFTLGLKEAYREIFDYENKAYPDDFTNPDTQSLFLSEDRTERVSRQLLDLAGILTWRISDKLASDYSVAYGTIEYDTEFLYDWTDLKYQAEFDYRVTDKTALLLTGQYGQQESDALDNNPDYYVLRGGFLNRATDKLTFKGGVGAGKYDRFRSSSTNGVSGIDDEISNEEDGAIDYLSFDMAGDWDLTQRTKLQLIGRNAIQPAAQYQDNVKLVTVASVGISHRILDDFRLAGTISYRNDDYEDPVEIDTDEFIDQEDTIWGGQLRLDFEPPNGYIDVYVEARYEDRTTTIPNEDYDQLRLTIGLKLKI
jgi:hypothetical protein